MSALPPKADKWQIVRVCPLCAITGGEQMRQIEPLFDHLVGAPRKGEWEGDAEGFGCLQIDQQLNFRDLLHRQIGRLVALEDASGIDTGLTVGIPQSCLRSSSAHRPG